MSGITGIVRLDGAPVSDTEIHGMLRTLRRRGPHRQAALTGEASAFAQALLATTPEAAAESQPYVAPGSRCIVISDSRLDDRPHLLAKLGLRRGHADSIGDGELLHAAWQRWGEACVEHLLGDFAFALWAPERRRLFLARDAFGVRPLYYHHAPGRLFAFASQVDSLLALPDVPRDVDPARIADAMLGDLEGVDSVSSFYPAIRRLAPAHSLVLGTTGSTVRRYWSVAPLPDDGGPAPEADWPAAVRAALDLSVRRRLRASCRVGAMLSGGLDSGSVVALARQASSEPAFAVFSAIDSCAGCTETDGIRCMHGALALESHCIDIADPSLPPELRVELDQLAEPFDGAMPLVTAQYVMAARAAVPVLLDGLPADVLYGIGDRAQVQIRAGALAAGFRLLRDRSIALVQPWPRASALRSTVTALLPAPLRAARREAVARREYRRLLAGSLLDEGAAEALELKQRFLDAARVAATCRTAPDHSVMDSPDIHAAVDRYGRVAARHGVEPRHPFLDRELVELHRRIPAALMNRDGWNKWPLRQAMAGLLPTAVAWAPPHPHLGLSFNHRVMGPLLEAKHPAVGDARNPLDRGKAAAALLKWRRQADPGAFGALLDAWLVGFWLQRNSSTGLQGVVDRDD